MKRNIIGTLALLAALAAGCGRDEGTSAATGSTAARPAIAEVDVPELARMLEAREAVAVDANGTTTRERYGVIPDARLLSSSSRYELSELPSDKATTLVFYCANTNCTASDTAADRAAGAGYEDVRVLRAGISGWRDAGKPTTPPSS